MDKTIKSVTMEKIMTYNEWWRLLTFEEVDSIMMKDGDCENPLAEAYARYYAKSIIEGLTDEEIVNFAKIESCAIVADEEEGTIEGARWVRQELLNRIK